MSWFSNALFGSPHYSNTDFSQLKTLGENMLNPLSLYNQRNLNNLQAIGLNNVAQQDLGNQKLGAMGVNPFANEQTQQARNSVVGQVGDSFNQSLNQSANVGSGLLSNYFQFKGNQDQYNASIGNQRSQMGGLFLQSLLGQGMPLAGQGAGALAGLLKNLF